MNRFRRGRPELTDEDLPPEVVPARNKPLSREEQRLMFEGSTHWGRGLAILLGMAGVLIVFLVILTALPKPAADISLDSLTNFGSSSNATLTGAAGATATPAPAARLATVAPVAAAPGATGTPRAGWTGAVRSGVPNVRSAPNTNNTPVGNLQPGTSIQVLGRSPDNAWYQIVWNGNQKAWVASDLLNIVSGDATKIPVVSQ